MIRLNIPFVLHFQAWSEERSEGAPFLIHDKVRNSLNVGGRFIQLNQSEGDFLLLETNHMRLQLGAVGVHWPG
jgi:hypothetical protein